MKFAMSCSAVLLALLVASAGAKAAQKDESVSGVQKVIQMLTDMSYQAKKEKQEEEVLFTKFTGWCQNEKAALTKEIKDGGEQIEFLAAEIDKLTAEVKELNAQIDELTRLVDTSEADKKLSEEQRAKDHKGFIAESTDYKESVSALERAITALKKENYDRPAAAAVLLQLSESQQMPDNARSMIAAFLGMMNDESGDFAPEANAYEFQSGGIIEMLKKLLGEFEVKLGQCEKEEMNSVHAHNMVLTDLTDTIENSNRDIEEKTESATQKANKAALNKKEKASTERSKAEDEKELATTTAECTEKSLSYDEKQQLRAEEIEAIEKAIEILDSDAVVGGAEKHLGLVQSKSATSLLQFEKKETATAGTEGIRRKVREFLAREGHRLHSRSLGLLSEKLAADPFAKVKKMIDDMLTRLLEEANADADHEGFCDKEIGESKITRAKLQKTIEALTAAIEEGKANIIGLAQDIANLEKELAQIDAAVKEATEIRNEEKAKNKAIVKDAKAAIAATEAATAVLKDFYTKAAKATGFLQESAKGINMGSDEWTALANPNFEGTVDSGHKEGMQTFGESYTGQQSRAGGVMAMLETILSDFANLKTETEADEAVAAKEYSDFMIESRKSTAVKEKSLAMANADKVAAEEKLREDTTDLKYTQDKLLAAERYYEKLEPKCIDEGMTFEERTAARQAEVTSLKEALELLNSEDITSTR